MTTESREIIDSNVVPPTTNRGALNTSPITFLDSTNPVETLENQGLRALIDWFQGTFKSVTDFREITNILGLDSDDFKETNRGSYGWTSCYSFGNIFIYHGGTTQLGMHLEIKGQGCRLLETMTVKNWISIIQDSLSYGFKSTRLDLAIDDFGIPPKRKRGGAKNKPHFTVRTLLTKARQGLCRSKFEYGREIGKFSLGDGSDRGNTIYFGSETSRIQIRVYEKHWERKNKGFELENGIEIWNRIEVQARKERAEEACRRLASGTNAGEIVAGIIKNYVNFVDRNEDDPNKSRWKVSRFWKNFLGDVEPLSLTLVAPDRTLERVEHWFERQIDPSLVVMYLANDGDMGYFENRIREAVDRLSDKDYEMIERSIEEYKRTSQLKKAIRLREKRDEALHKLYEMADLDEEQILLRDTEWSNRRVKAHENKNARYAIGSDQGTQQN